MLPLRLLHLVMLLLLHLVMLLLLHLLLLHLNLMMWRGTHHWTAWSHQPHPLHSQLVGSHGRSHPRHQTRLGRPLGHAVARGQVVL